MLFTNFNSRVKGVKLLFDSRGRSDERGNHKKIKNNNLGGGMTAEALTKFNIISGCGYSTCSKILSKIDEKSISSFLCSRKRRYPGMALTDKITLKSVN